MRAQKIAYWVGIPFAAITFLFSLVDIDDELIAMFPFVTPLVKYTKAGLVLAFALLIVAGVVFLLVLLWGLWNTRASVLSGLGGDSCKESDLEELHSIARKNLSEVTSLDQTRELYRHNKHCIIKIVDTRKAKKTVGYVVLLPLTTAGSKRIEEKNFSALSDGLDIFGKRLPNRHDYYIGAAVSPDRKTRAKAVELIKNFCAKKKVRTLYSRPTTDAGLKSLSNNGFVPVHPDDKAELGVLFVRRL